MARARPQSTVSAGRHLAFTALQAARAGRGFAAETLDRILDQEKASSADAHLATELAMGVVRWRLTLRRLLRPFVRGQWERLEPALVDALLMAAYQLWMLDRIPAHAAVGESVALARTHCGRPAGGLANAVLRNMLRQLSAERVPIEQLSDDSDCLWRDGPTGLRFSRPVWPDPADRPLEHVAVTTSHPPMLVRRWVDHFGLDATRAICRANQHRPPIILRPNPLRCLAQTLQAKLADEGVHTRLHQDGGMLVVEGSASVQRLKAFAAGLFQPQDPTAAAPVRAGNPRPGETILDLCAAPGGKATQAAELTQDRGTIIASDVSEAKLARLQHNAERLGLRSICCVAAKDLRSRLAESAAPDLIIVDVPCSNTGVLARRPEARYRFNARRLHDLVTQAEGLLATATSLAGRSARVVYATCSIEPEENDRLIEGFCRSHGRWRMADSRLTLPDAGSDPAHWHGGGYWALLLADR